jgi:DNA-binding Lrp family transcriptional regulator
MSGSGADTFAVWTYLLANADREGCLEINPRIIAASIGMSAESVSAVVDKLQQPDPASRSKKEDGRRITRVGEFLYEIVNYKTYRDIQTSQHRNDYMKKYMADKRILEKAKNLIKNEDSKKVLNSVNFVSGQVDVDVKVDVEGEAKVDTNVEEEAKEQGKGDCKEGKPFTESAVEPLGFRAALRRQAGI